MDTSSSVSFHRRRHFTNGNNSRGDQNTSLYSSPHNEEKRPRSSHLDPNCLSCHHKVALNGQCLKLLLRYTWLILIYTAYRGYSYIYLNPNSAQEQTPFDTNTDTIGQCLPLKSWQEMTFPICNALHEIDLSTPAVFLEDASYVAHGFIRDVWKVPIYPLALKTLRWEEDFTPACWQGQNFDALVSERLTRSRFVANIYGYCGFSALYDYSPEGNLQEHLHSLSKQDRLRIAMEITSALADLHSIDDPTLATVVHADISSRQFIKDGKQNSYLLTDFNTASPLYYRCISRKKNSNCRSQQCPYYINKAKGKYRAPEEMLYNNDEGGNPVSEKIDVYSMGNIFYELLTGNRKYHDMLKEDAQALILKGHVPPIVNSFLNSDNQNDSIEYQVDRILSKAIQMCLVRDPRERASAREVADFLMKEWRNLEETA